MRKSKQIGWKQYASLQAWIVAICLLTGTLTARANPVIYEPFADNDSTLTGNASGTGLSGTWTATGCTVVSSNLPSYGLLGAAGNGVEVAAGGNANVQTTTAVADAGLLADGATLWFSVVLRNGTYASGQHSGFGFGSAAVSSAYNGLNMTGGDGVGFYCKNALKAITWTSGTNAVSAAQFSLSTVDIQLIVGKVEWGATLVDVETITLYLISDLTDLSLPATSLSVTSLSGFDQTNLNIVSFSHRDGGTQFYDEIRFGATFADVTPPPPPTGTVVVIK